VLFLEEALASSFRRPACPDGLFIEVKRGIPGCADDVAFMDCVHVRRVETSNG